MAARERGDELVLPASAYAECLVAPSRRGPEAVATTDQFVDALPARVEPASRAICAAAAALRAAHGRALRLSDALVVATGRVLGADRIVTTDAGWPVLGIVVDVISRRQVPEWAASRFVGATPLAPTRLHLICTRPHLRPATRALADLRAYAASLTMKAIASSIRSGSRTAPFAAPFTSRARLPPRRCDRRSRQGVEGPARRHRGGRHLPRRRLR